MEGVARGAVPIGLVPHLLKGRGKRCVLMCEYGYMVVLLQLRYDAYHLSNVVCVPHRCQPRPARDPELNNHAHWRGLITHNRKANYVA